MRTREGTAQVKEARVFLIGEAWFDSAREAAAAAKRNMEVMH